MQRLLNRYVVASMLWIFCVFLSFESMAAVAINCRAKDKNISFELSGILSPSVGSVSAYKIHMRIPILKVRYTTKRQTSITSTLNGEQLFMIFDLENELGGTSPVILEFRLLNTGQNTDGGVDWNGSYKLLEKWPRKVLSRGKAQCSDGM